MVENLRDPGCPIAASPFHIFSVKICNEMVVNRAFDCKNHTQIWMIEIRGGCWRFHQVLRNFSNSFLVGCRAIVES